MRWWSGRRWSRPRLPRAQAVDPEAERILRSMTDHLASLRSFSVKTEASTEVILQDGRKIQLTASGTAVVDRERGFRFERLGPFGRTQAVHDGASVSISSEGLGVWLSVPASGGLDVALDEVRAVFGTEAAGGADLLYSNPLDGLLLEVESGHYMGEAIIAGERAHHLSYRLARVDWQLWIRAEGDPLPLRYVITSKWTTGAPQFTAQFSDWVPGFVAPAGSFAFTPPAGAREIDPYSTEAFGLLTEE